MQAIKRRGGGGGNTALKEYTVQSNLDQNSSRHV